MLREAVVNKPNAVSRKAPFHNNHSKTEIIPSALPESREEITSHPFKNSQ